jgi:hypothetical protein
VTSSIASGTIPAFQDDSRCSPTYTSPHDVASVIVIASVPPRRAAAITWRSVPCATTDGSPPSYGTSSSSTPPRTSLPNSTPSSTGSRTPLG